MANGNLLLGLRPMDAGHARRALLRLVGASMLTPAVGPRSGSQGQFVERDRHPPVRRLLHRKLVPSAS